jgi:hypothetical protein
VLVAAVLPHPPVLVPEVAGGAAGELNALRDACDAAVRAVVDAGPDLVVVVGSAPARRRYLPGAVGSLQAFGVDVTVTLGAGPNAADPMPLSLTIGSWLLGRAGWPGDVLGLALPVGATPDEAAAAGADLAGAWPRLGLLVMGDGSARLSERAPGFVDPRAPGFEAAVAAALAAGDPGALLALDPALADDLLVAGRVPWQALAGAARRALSGTGARVSARLLRQEAPYGVDYLVSTWTVEAP